MTTAQNIIISIVEGLTEFLPVSSTGHMIITEKILNIAENDFSKVFTVAIQLGAILAVVVLSSGKNSLILRTSSFMQRSQPVFYLHCYWASSSRECPAGKLYHGGCFSFGWWCYFVIHR